MNSKSPIHSHNKSPSVINEEAEHENEEAEEEQSKQSSNKDQKGLTQSSKLDIREEEQIRPAKPKSTQQDPPLTWNFKNWQ